MKLGDLYKSVVSFGMDIDPRGKAQIKKELLRAKKSFDELPKEKKKFFDKDSLMHPYSDTRILCGDPKKDIKTILLGIDMEVGEIILADRLKEKGKKIDLVLAHHPEGQALAGFFNVMYIQVDILVSLGVPINIAESLMSDRIREVERRVLPANHMRAVDAAKLLNIPFMTCHTPADNCVVKFLQELMNKKKPDTLGDIMEILIKIPEYETSALQNSAPKIVKGTNDSKAGKIFVDMTGGTEGSKDIFSRLAQKGVSTLLCMHLSDEHLKKAREEHINVIIAGHIASDNIGLNILLDKLEKKSKLNIIPTSGFRRFIRHR